MTLKKALISLLLGTGGPTLVSLQALQLMDLTRPEYWLGVATLAITSFAASGTTVLTVLANDNGITFVGKTRGE